MLHAGDLVIPADTVNNFWYPLIYSAIILFVGWLLDRKSRRRTDDLRKRIEDTHYEITNDHTKPLRNDLDDKFNKQNKLLLAMASKLNDHTRAINRLQGGRAIDEIKLDDLEEPSE